MSEVIIKGTPYRYYDFECPKCHSIVRFGESELHEYEDCYDTEMIETDEVCPNCLDSYIQVPKSQLHEHLVKSENLCNDKKTIIKSLWKIFLKKN